MLAEIAVLPREFGGKELLTPILTFPLDEGEGTLMPGLVVNAR